MTKEGRTLSDHLGKALDEIEHAVAQVRKTDQNGTLKVTIAPFFGNRWLLPRLPDFHKKHPDIKITPSLSFDYVDIAQSGFDAAVRYGAGDWDGMSCALIYHDIVSPVCAPKLINGRQLPLSARDILDLPLACGGRWREDWLAWAKESGVEVTHPEQIVEYESRAFMFDAALSGQAVILADFGMTAADEAAGSLVRLSPITVKRSQGIYVVSEAKPNPDPRLQVFANWLQQQASE